MRVGDSLLSPAGQPEPAAPLVPADGRLLLSRSSRRVPGDAGPVELPVRDDESAPRRGAWLAALLPAIGAGALAWVLGMPVLLLFALLSPVMLAANALGERAGWRRRRRRSERRYTRQLAAAQAEIAAGLARETARRRRDQPNPCAVERMVTPPSVRLWERTGVDPDRLRVRLGSADLPARLRCRTGDHEAPAGTVPLVPLTVDLAASHLGIAGPEQSRSGLARWVVSQLAVQLSPAELSIELLLTEEAEDRWRWSRWLPQVRDTPGTGPATWPRVLARLRHAAVTDTGRASLLVVDDPAGLPELPGLAQLLGSTGSTVAAVCVTEEPSALPAACDVVADCGRGIPGQVVVRSADPAGTQHAVTDSVSRPWASRVARALAPLADADDSTSRLPREVRLVDLLSGPASNRSPGGAPGHGDGGARVVLGVGADGPVVVDLVTDGPHALVAGTTGSGKSELLRCLVLSLAATYPPPELSLLLLDYKGGSAFAHCAGLPHVGALVTDLDGHLTGRALAALRAELRRREQLFAAAGAADLDAYRRLGRDHEPVSRLVIVVDEFAVLADEFPEFVDGLVAIARRGRSLGLHLVLATQRPGTAVTADIRANTALRIALRVTDAAESSRHRRRPRRCPDRPRPAGAGGAAHRHAARAVPGGAVATAEPTRTKPDVQDLGSWRSPLPRDARDRADTSGSGGGQRRRAHPSS